MAAWTGTGPSSGYPSPVFLWVQFCSHSLALLPASSFLLCTILKMRRTHIARYVVSRCNLVNLKVGTAKSHICEHIRIAYVKTDSALKMDDKTLDFNSLLFQVANYLPSISAAISRVPERYIWRCCIGLHSAPRYLIAAAYFNFYYGRFAKRLPELLLSVLALICSLSENTGLLLLTYVSSTETYSEFKCLEH